FCRVSDLAPVRLTGPGRSDPDPGATCFFSQSQVGWTLFPSFSDLVFDCLGMLFKPKLIAESGNIAPGLCKNDGAAAFRLRKFSRPGPAARRLRPDRCGYREASPRRGCWVPIQRSISGIWCPRKFAASMIRASALSASILPPEVSCAGAKFASCFAYEG